MTATDRSVPPYAGSAASTRPFWVVVAASTAMMVAAGAPSPLYVVYAERIGFSAITLTVIFAVYVVALLATLLTIGALSDFVGRRPVLIGSFLLEIVSMALFLPADSVGWLLLARTVQGVATGAALGALGAALIDHQPPGSQLGTLMNSVVPGIGLAAGALGAGALIQYAPDPTRIVFWALLAMMALVLVAIARLPETAPRRRGGLASLRPDVRVPPPTRPAFLAAVPVFLATWAVGGLYLALGGSLAVDVFGLTDHLVGGMVVVAVTASGAVASFLVHTVPPRRAMRIGCAVLVCGLLVTLVGIATGSVVLFFLGSVVTGFGFGGSFTGALRSVMNQATADSRAATMSAVLTASYLAFSVPAIIAGYAATRIGLRDTATAYALAAVVVTLAAIAIDRSRPSPGAVSTPRR